jgi:hypothetical protein
MSLGTTEAASHRLVSDRLSPIHRYVSSVPCQSPLDLCRALNPKALSNRLLSFRQIDELTLAHPEER